MKIMHDLGVNSVLEIGPGESFVADYMRSLDVDYDTLDSDHTSDPTILSDLRSWDPGNSSWELVAAFQILEHMPFSDFENNIEKLISASEKYVFISLPYHCYGFRFRFNLSFGQMKRYLFDFGFHLPTFFKNRRYRQDYMSEFPFAVHHWEIGRRPYYTWAIEKVFKKKGLVTLKKFHSVNPYHYFYLLEKQ